MPTPQIRIAKLDDQTIEMITAMEEEFGHSIVALEPYFPPAKLTEAQIQRLEALEHELGVVLLAYQK
ncbi:MAG: hypothetical protein WCS70_12205 [Verrucomicrobiota bacterium]